MDIPTKIEDFYGVYLLCSQSPLKQYNGRCYIGFTVNPNRRIKQHNRGRDFGGAKKTSNRGPWQMVMIVHGFPNNVSALQFEWAWQSPKQSSRLRHNSSLSSKQRNESHFQYNFRILTEMLRTGPWNRLPLVIRWLTPDYVTEFPAERIPPIHMQICHGPVSIGKKKAATTQDDYLAEYKARIVECHLCMTTIDNPTRSKVTCLNPKCKLTSHIVCLANHCLVNETTSGHGQLVPVEGDCPICERHFLWGDLIRKKNGCSDLREGDLSDRSSEDSSPSESDLEPIDLESEAEE